MSLRILLQDHPQRAIAIATDTHALVFRHSLPNTADGGSLKSAPPRSIVEFSSLKALDLSHYRSLYHAGVHGTLGLININTDIFLCVISKAVRVATVRPGENVQRIQGVEFCCLNKNDFDYQSYGDPNAHAYPTGDFLSDGHDSSSDADPRDQTFEHPCVELKKVLSGGTFYYSVDFDLTNRLQSRIFKGSTFDLDSLEEDFLWNSYMIDPLVRFRARLTARERDALDESQILTSAIRGFVLTIIIPATSTPIKTVRTNLPSTLTLISRLSCRRAGTRFNSRGIDDDGYVANFVESETVYWHPSSLCFSYVQIRGSVPVFWEQAAGLLPAQQKMQITRSPEATQPAFDKHFELLELKYGTIHILNLLSASKPGEVELTTRYKHHVTQSSSRQVIELDVTEGQRMLQHTQFDFHAETKGPAGYEAASNVRRLIQNQAEGFIYFLCNDAESGSVPAIHESNTFAREPAVVLQQGGVFRTNCLDCLDRTNLVQTIISQMAVESFLNHRGERASAEFWMRHSSIWADNGDALSRIYAGTGALKSSFTRHGKMSLAGAIADARKSAARLYINNFADKGRQNTTDMLLGRLIEQSPIHLHDPIHDFVISELKKRVNEYSTSEAVHFWVGTFNLNGRGEGTKENLAAWLCPQINKLQRYPEIVAVGFQEIVELSPQQIMSTDPVRRQAWEQAILKTLNENAGTHAEYVLVRSGQLVGTALIIFVKYSALKNIRNVECSVKKTGLSGMAGNKGAVAIRMDYGNTRACFITAHLAAGFANYEERNRDYRTISHGLRFQRNRSIEDHDTIIWLGDFNYRVGLNDEKVRRLVHAGDLDTLYKNDQLNLQMMAGRAFPYYSEARITFMPTYKYNNGTDSYDTSENARIPAWCDRILKKGDQLKQINYTTAPLYFSDHRPVYATFQCTISYVDESVKERLTGEIYEKRKSQIEKFAATARGVVIDTDITEYESIGSELPVTSSDHNRWWLDDGLAARSNLEAPSKDAFPNPNRPSNPFNPKNELDWVVVPNPIGTEAESNRRRLDTKPMVGPNSTLPRQSNVKQMPLSSLTQDKAQNSALELGKTMSAPSLPPPSLMGSGITRKPAPPVPRKPPILISSNNDCVDLGRIPSSVSAEQSIPIRWTSATQPSESGRPTLDPYTTSQPSLQLTALKSAFSSDHTKNQEKPAAEADRLPALPSRITTAQRPVPKGLLDKSDEGACLIPPIQPIRRQS